MLLRTVRIRVRLGCQLLAVAVVALFLWPMPATAATTQASYRVDDLGALGGDGSSVAWGINAAGQVVGWSNGPTGTRAFVYSDGTGIRLLAAPGDRPHTLARAINDAGVVVGSATTGGTDLGHAVRWTNGVPRDLGTLGVGPFSEAYGVNAAGTAVGYSYADGAHLDGTHGFRQDDAAAMVDLTPAGSAEAHAINAVGQVAGWRNGQAFRWQTGTLSALPVPTGFAQSFGYAINAAGQVAGSTISASGNTERPFRYTDGVGSVVLGGVGEHNQAFGINGTGDVVGTGRAVSGPSRAFIYTDRGGMVDLNTLINPASGLVLLGASGINDAGQIAAYGFNNLTGLEHGLRLTPIGTASLPSAPTALVATGVSTSSIGLAWTDNASNESGFRVERRTGTSPFVKVAATDADTTTFVDTTGLDANTIYDYRVYAFNGAGASASSNVVSAATSGADTTAPAVRLVAPKAGATVSGRVRVRIVASDNVAVASVRVLVDDVIKCQATASPLTCTWDARRAIGVHTVSAVAVDSSGNQASSSIRVTVVR